MVSINSSKNYLITFISDANNFKFLFKLSVESFNIASINLLIL